MPAVPVLKLSTTHEQLLNWLVLNPEKSMRECADTFGYTQAWLSSLVHSDIFQASLKEKQLAVMSRVCSSIPAKLQAVTQIALDKLAEQVERSEDGEFILAVADKALHRLGYAPASARQPAGPQGPLLQQNTYVVQSGELAEARALMRMVHSQQQPHAFTIDGEVVPVPEEITSADDLERMVRRPTLLAPE